MFRVIWIEHALPNSKFYRKGWNPSCSFITYNSFFLSFFLHKSLRTRKKGSDYFKQTQLGELCTYKTPALRLPLECNTENVLNPWNESTHEDAFQFNPFMTDPIKWWLQKYSHTQVVFLCSWVKFVSSNYYMIKSFWLAECVWFISGYLTRSAAHFKVALHKIEPLNLGDTNGSLVQSYTTSACAEIFYFNRWNTHVEPFGGQCTILLWRLWEFLKCPE
jgi:hypothetical protein